MGNAADYLATALARNEPAIRGVAWSGMAPIERVEVNTGGAWHRLQSLAM